MEIKAPATAAAWSARRWDAVGVITLAVAMLPWWIALRLPFLGMDDGTYVMDNAAVQQGLNFKTAAWTFTSTAGSLWQPMTWLSLLLDSTLWGTGPVGFHATNVLLHVANAVLLFLFLHRVTGRPARSLLVAAFFAVHPLRVESVAWVTERKDVLSLFFGLLAMLAYWKYVSVPPANRRRAALWYGAVCAAFACSLMAKLMLATLPAVLLLLDFWPLDRLSRATWKRCVVEKIPLLGISIAAVALISAVLQHVGVVTRSLSPSYKICNALLSCFYYLRDHAYFEDLSVYYPEGLPINIVDALGAAALLVGLTVGAVILWRKAPAIGAPVLVGWLWFIGTLAPTMGLMQSGSQSRADRFTYFPSIGLCIAVVWIWPDAWWREARRRRWAALAGSGCVVVLTVYTTLRVLLWRDPLALYLDGIAHTGGANPFLELMAGKSLAAAGNFPAAIDMYQRAAFEAPQTHETHYNLGIAYYAVGRRRDAAEQFRIALQLAPNNPTYKSVYEVALTQPDRPQR